MAIFIEDEVVGDVPDAAGDGDSGEDESEFADVLLHLAAVGLVAALAALVVDDEHGAVRAANDAVRAQVVDVVNDRFPCFLQFLLLFLAHAAGDGALAVDPVSGVKPSGDTASWIHDVTADVGVDALDAAGIIGVAGDGSMLDSLGDNALKVIATTDAAKHRVEAQSRVDV